MKTPGERGPVGRWLLERRLARGYETQKDALEAFRRLGGFVVDESSYAQWESGSRTPRSNNKTLLRIVDFYGGPNPLEVEEQPQTAPDLATALLRLTEELGLWRVERERMASQLAELEATVALLVQGSAGGLGSGAPSVHAPPPATGE